MFRGKLLLYLFLGAFIAIFLRLAQIQVLEPGTYARDFLQSRKLHPERGRIYDRNQMPLAVNQMKYRLFVEPQRVDDMDEIIEGIDSILEIGEATLEAQIDEEKVWVAIRGGLSPESRAALQALELDGIGFENEPARFYPESSLSAHLLGFVGKNEDNESVGYFGVEGYYDKELRGLPGKERTERDAFNKPIFVGTQDRIEAINGRDVMLTIDKTVQNIVKTKLNDAMEEFDASQACATVADPKTMEILALSCLPDFNPDRYYEASPEAYVNTVISDLYEPGSTFKPLIMAAALNEDKIKPLDTFNESGPLDIGEYTIQNWNKKYIGTMSMTNILERSSNIGMVYIGRQLGDELLVDYLDRYGLGQPTSIDLQGEVGGSLRSQWYEIDYATATFGQGVSVTQLQLLRAFASLINGGYLMEPYIVKEIHQDDRIRKQEPVIVRRVLDKHTSDVMKEMLRSTVANGEMPYEFPEGYEIGGKTGTAQVAVGGKYDASKTIASFIGFAPVDDPKFLTLVVIKEPKTSIWGSQTAAPVFFQIAKDLFVHYNIVPDSPSPYVSEPEE